MTTADLLTLDERRTARLLFSAELADGLMSEADIATSAEVAEAVREADVPTFLGRVRQAQARRTGRFDAVRAAVDAGVRARRAVLGDAAARPPRLLVRMDEYPHWRARQLPETYGDAAFAPWRDIMAEAGCAHLVAVVPRIADDPMKARGDSRELTDTEVERLRQLADDGVVFGLHGLDHRTRYAHPRLHTELGGRSLGNLDDLIDTALATLKQRTGITPRVLVPPFNTFRAGQYSRLARKFDVVTGGPESILRVGYRPGPVWWDESVYLPAYPPMYGTAADIIPELRRQIDEETGLWTPVVLHWGWEADRGWTDLKGFAAIAAPYAVSWNEFLAAVEECR